MGQKTVAMRLLEGKNISYATATYPDTIRDAEEVAAWIGVPAAQVFKTLVVARRPEKSLLVLLPADRQLDLKKLARLVGAKKLKLATQRQAEELTGLQVGGISPLALLHRGFKVIADDALLFHQQVYLSSGQRGQQIAIAPADLVALTGLMVAPVT